MKPNHSLNNAVTPSTMWRSLLGASAAVLSLFVLSEPSFAQTLAAGAESFNTPLSAKAGAPPEDKAIRPFHVKVPQQKLDDLRRRIAATRWPEKEAVTDQSQGVQLAKLQALVSYWEKDYDWRKAEAKLNALPQFITTIDGVDIQFVHVKSRNANAMPLIMTHGWPGSVLELLKVIGPLTDPTAYGGSVEDAFDLVLPSIPGYGFSGRPTSVGSGPDRIRPGWPYL